MKFVIRIFFHGIKHHYQAIGHIYVKLITISSSQNQHLNIVIYFSNGENIQKYILVYLKVHLHIIKSCTTFPKKKMFALAHISFFKMFCVISFQNTQWVFVNVPFFKMPHAFFHDIQWVFGLDTYHAS